QVYLDDSTGQPSWVTVNTGLFGTSESFVPLEGASFSGSDLTVSYPKSQVKDAPKVAADGHLDVSEEEELYRYYGLGGGFDTDTTVRDETITTGTTTGTADVSDRDNVHGTVGHDTSGPTTDDAMTRSEEHLTAGTQRVTAGKARLRKYVTTEQQSVTVPVSREEVRLEREPITDANMGNAMDGPAISEEEHEVVLTEERPVVSKEAVPVERVRLDKETVTEQQTVSGEVRKEHIDLDDDSRITTDRER
ncbi:MAG TPA: YsnF/AvaK domain-containing protein, partial [Actinomycetales bacterium]